MRWALLSRWGISMLASGYTEGCTTAAMDGVAENGHLKSVTWLYTLRKEGCTHEAMDLVAIKGHLNVVKWLHRHRSEGCSHEAMIDAAIGNHVHVIEWLHLNRQKIALLQLLIRLHCMARFKPHSFFPGCEMNR
ncbi:hypothetical protein PPTG_24333 [Phytophthora nicotianae INRA-310]|uniref:Uncharacterized protein n=3 Tax=Phytophthora nicotianae TaxID=4792 RepID=W2PIB8_PHYN3|nr:hypothetical protein PPTG_24333 [Phytophthora nicotianae INRA-310]ETI32049.1 hypothetical protein F443_21061 [Phytophthora nicotianae P1569]ETL25884.1 hypothetical protein L916_20329 [Phytophthora nicotianae]ETM32354.1 hypothetical protein L914_20217 [Phytophthora nicotianae]ETM99978.1 hypothetical protein PPTG_24333 [Phytophthora nicotianae INRA-310]